MFEFTKPTECLFRNLRVKMLGQWVFFGVKFFLTSRIDVTTKMTIVNDDMLLGDNYYLLQMLALGLGSLRRHGNDNRRHSPLLSFREEVVGIFW